MNITEKYTKKYSEARSDIWHAGKFTISTPFNPCGHTVLVKTVITLSLMYPLVTIFCNNFYVCVCPLRHLLNYRIIPHPQNVEIF